MTSWNWNIGALFTVAPQTKIGVVLSFDHKIYAEWRHYSQRSEPSLASALVNSDAEADIKLPDTFILSVAQGIGDQLGTARRHFVDGLEQHSATGHHSHIWSCFTDRSLRL